MSVLQSITISRIIVDVPPKAQVIARTASALPDNDPLRDILTKLMVNTLFKSLHHPPLSYKGPQFQHRAADGGYNVSHIYHYDLTWYVTYHLFRTICSLSWAEQVCHTRRQCRESVPLMELNLTLEISSIVSDILLLYALLP